MTEAWWQVVRKPWDKSEFEALFLSHYDSIYRLLLRVVGSPEEAEDLAQETFLRLYCQHFVPGREHNVRAWLYRVATNLAYNALRGRRRQEQRQQAAGQPVAGPAEQAPDPAETALRRDEQEAVRRVLLALPRRQVRLLLMYHAGLSYCELASALGIAPGSVGTLLARAKAAFEARYRATVLSEDRGGGHEV